MCGSIVQYNVRCNVSFQCHLSQCVNWSDYCITLLLGALRKWTSKKFALSDLPCLADLNRCSWCLAWLWCFSVLKDILHLFCSSNAEPFVQYGPSAVSSIINGSTNSGESHNSQGSSSWSMSFSDQFVFIKVKVCTKKSESYNLENGGKCIFQKVCVETWNFMFRKWKLQTTKIFLLVNVFCRKFFTFFTT